MYNLIEMPLETLEKPAALQILSTIFKNGEKETLSTDLVENVERSSHTVYSAIKQLLKGELIQEEWKEKPRRRIFTLTEKGKKVAELLVQIEEILKGG